MSKLYALKRCISDFNWNASRVDTLCISSDNALLDRIAEERSSAHRTSEHIYEY